eukprot:Ihof_evm1s1266 gene=Ihof_evmTU1s1266
MELDNDKLKKAIRSVLQGKDRDFAQVTVKKARQWVEELLETDLTDKKPIFKDLLVEVLEELRSKDEPQSSDESSNEDEPPKKKRGRPPSKAKESKKSKKDISDEDDYGNDANDEDLANDLHVELNSRGKRGAKKIKKPKKATGDKPKRNTGLNAPQHLSPALQVLMGGQTEMPRTEVVKQLWVLIRERGLQDPTNKRNILCDK